MRLRRPRHAPCWLYLAFSPSLFPFLLPIALTYADAVNITVDDTSSSIQYSPASSWHASSTPCSTCLAPNASIAFGGTWHDGTHIIPTEDDDDLPSAQRANAGSTNNSASQSHSSTSSPSPTASQKGGDDDKDSSNGKDDDNDDDDKMSAGKKHRRRGPTTTANRLPRQTNNPFFTPNFDSDDAGFHDEPVTAQFNFTGSAVYLFAIMPLGAAAANSTPTFMNLTYTLDSQPVGIFQHTGASSAFGFLPSVPVFSKSGLSEGPHSLTVQIGPDSVLLLDYIVYSQDNGLGLGSSPNEAVSTTQDTAGAQETASGTGSTGPSSNPATSNMSMSSKSHNVATFAGAVGGSVGLLAVLAFSLAVSLYRRRLLAARRDRHYRHARTRSNPDFDGESFHTDGSEDGPPMQGPAPFVPRYFPGTVIPSAPPPYAPPDATTSLLDSASPINSPVILWPVPRVPAPGEDLSYADRPPPTPPPMMEDGYFPPPPSFPIAISTPIPAILAGYSTIASSIPVTATPVPRHSNGSSSRGVYSSDTPSTRSRANSETRSNASRASDRPPSFASETPPTIPPPSELLFREERTTGESGDSSHQRTSDVQGSLQ